MTYKIHKVQGYLLVVDDSEIKVGNYFYSIRGIVEQAVIDYPKNEHHGVIIAHIPINGSPILEGVDLLPPIEDDVIELADKWVFDINGYKWSNNDSTAGDNFGSYIAGYNKAKEKYKYTEEDMRKAISETRKGMLFNKKYEDEYIESIHQYPTEFECEVEHVLTIGKTGYPASPKEIIKTITTDQGIQWMGKYK